MKYKKKKTLFFNILFLRKLEHLLNETGVTFKQNVCRQHVLLYNLYLNSGEFNQLSIIMNYLDAVDF